MPIVQTGDRQTTIPEGFEDPGLPHQHVFSPSQYGMYKRCAKQYYFRYVCDMKIAPKIAMWKGSRIHAGAEKTHRCTIETGKPLEFEAAKAAVSDDFDKRKEEIEDWEDNKPEHVKQQTLNNFAVYYRTAVPVIHPKQVELGFSVKFGSVPVIGYIDLVDEVTDDIKSDIPFEKGMEIPKVEVVSDLKCTGKLWPEQKLRYDHQLTFYAHAMSTPRVRIDFLLDQKSGTRYEPKKSLRNPHDVKQLIESLEETVDLIKRGVFPKILPSEWMCSPEGCGYYQKCRGPK